jgi:hypothetical protein
MRTLGIAALLVASSGCGPQNQVVHVPYPAPDALTLVVVEGPLVSPVRVAAFERGGTEPGPVVFEAGTDGEVRVVAYDATLFDLGVAAFDAEPLPTDELGQLPEYGRTFKLIEDGEGARWIEETQPGRPLPSVLVPRRASATDPFSLRVIDFELRLPIIGIEVCVENAIPPQCALSGEGGLVEMASIGVRDDLVFVAQVPGGPSAYPPHLVTFSVKRAGGHLGNLLMVDRSLRTQAARAVNVILDDQTEGTLAFGAVSPEGLGLPGVSIEFAGAGRVVYFGGGGVEPSRTETDGSGFGGVLGVAPGEIEARFVHPQARCDRNPNGWRSTEPAITRSLVRPGHVTVLMPVICE